MLWSHVFTCVPCQRHWVVSTYHGIFTMSLQWHNMGITAYQITATLSFVQMKIQAGTNTKIPSYWSFVEGTTGDWWIPLTNGQLREKFSTSFCTVKFQYLIIQFSQSLINPEIIFSNVFVINRQFSLIFHAIFLDYIKYLKLKKVHEI